MNIQYVTNEKGKKQSVILPYTDWLKIDKLLNNNLFQEITAGLNQVKKIRDGKLPKKTFKQLVNEK